MISLIYVLSMLLFIIAVFMLPKSKEKQNAIVWIMVIYLVYESWACLWGGLFHLLKIPADILSIAIVNIIAAVIIFGLIYRSKKTQKYSIEIKDLLVMAILLMLAVYSGYIQFGASIQISYETTDPAQHYLIAAKMLDMKNVVPTNNDSFMYYSGFTNALVMGVFEPFVGFFNLYKIFIIKDVFNFFLCGMMFYALIKNNLKTKAEFVAGVLITLTYFWAYPRLNLNFGFVYWGIAITALTLVAFGAQLLMKEEKINLWALIIIAAGCLVISLSYSLFAPVAYLAAFACITMHCYKYDRKNIKKWFLVELGTFIVPFIYFLLFIFVLPRAYSTAGVLAAADALKLDGYCYRNLYGDFLLLIPFALYALIKKIRAKNFDFSVFLTLVTAGMTAYLLINMLMVNISTYYYYKMNILISFILFVLCVDAVCMLIKESKDIVICSAIFISGLAVCNFFGIDGRALRNNASSLEMNAATAPFEVYNHTNNCLAKRNKYSLGYIELFYEGKLCGDKIGKSLLFSEGGEPATWFSAMSKQFWGEEKDLFWLSVEDVKAFFEKNDGNEYMMMYHTSEGYQKYKSFFDKYTVIFENEMGIILQNQLKK